MEVLLPFCRANLPSEIECNAMIQKRVDGNDADAINHLGMRYLDGDEDSGIKKDTDKAFELFHRAAELGSSLAYNNLGTMYYNGEGVSKDEAKAKQYLEKAAIAGCAASRLNRHY
jgi:TPR repeat protein